jgi:hypothetical protein
MMDSPIALSARPFGLTRFVGLAVTTPPQLAEATAGAAPAPSAAAASASAVARLRFKLARLTGAGD